MNRKLLALYGLKWSPFSPEVPTEALHVTKQIEWFCWRVEQLVSDGGFALVTGVPGVGKSVTLRILADRLGAQQSAQVGILSRPQANLSDFFRELGELFGVPLRPHNRHAGSKVLRQRWQEHIDSSLLRPVLLCDEGQEMSPAVLAELRLLAAIKLDSHVLLTVVLAGDQRLAERFRSEELAPLGSRIRARLALEPASLEDLQACLRHALAKAGAPQLMTGDVIAALSEHAHGNYRALMNMAGELLAIAAQREIPQIDEKLFLEAFTPQASQQNRSAGRQRR
jgi:general secretion pathway protein A